MHTLVKRKNKRQKDETLREDAVTRRNHEEGLPGYCAAPALERKRVVGKEGGGQKQKGWLAIKAPLKFNFPYLPLSRGACL